MYYFGIYCNNIKRKKDRVEFFIKNKKYNVNGKLIHNFYRTNTDNVKCDIVNRFHFYDLIELSRCKLSDEDILKWMGYLKESFDICSELKEVYDNILEIYNINPDFFERNVNNIFHKRFAYTLKTFDNLEQLIDLHFDKILEHNRPDILISRIIEYQKINEEFIIKYINHFNLNHITEISIYQKHLSKEFIDKLKVYGKLK